VDVPAVFTMAIAAAMANLRVSSLLCFVCSPNAKAVIIESPAPTGLFAYISISSRKYFCSALAEKVPFAVFYQY